MASNCDSLVSRGSDLFFDFPCFTCQGNEKNREAEFSCEKCSKFYCGECVKYHNILYKKHVTLGNENFSQWSVANASLDVLEQCQKHKKELTAFCESHSELLCHHCHIYNHQNCNSKLIALTDKVKALHQNGDFTQLSKTVDILHEQFIQKKNDLQERMTSVENDYHKILKKISKLRNKINASLDKLEKNTIEELNTLLATMKTSIQTEIHQCTEYLQNMKLAQDDFQNITDKSEASQLIKYRTYMDQSTKTEAVLQEMTTKNVRTLTFTPETNILKGLSNLSGLGQILSQVKQSQSVHRGTKRTTEIEEKLKPLIAVSSQQHPLSTVKKPLVLQDQNQVIRVTGSKKYSVKTEIDKYHCMISGICVTGFGDLIITDYNNNQMKLLDQTYKVLALYQLRGLPWSMCSINPSLVAVVTFAEAINEVHFIRVTKRMLFNDRTLKLSHICTGIAHHKGNLFITARKALYQYNMSGTMGRKMFKVTNRKDMIGSCAISPDGEDICGIQNQ